MLIIGDVHELFYNYFQKIEGEDKTFQLGDMGLGFPGGKEFIIDTEGEHKFIRGNHDNPEVCKRHPNYAGDFGIYDNFFFVSGAFSIDKDQRIMGVSWWPEEELSITEGGEVLNLYEDKKPDIVVTHDCPDKIKRRISVFGFQHSRTGVLLENMLNIHKPKLWIFGHMHKSYKKKEDGCEFVGLNKLETYRM